MDGKDVAARKRSERGNRGVGEDQARLAKLDGALRKLARPSVGVADAKRLEALDAAARKLLRRG